ncbi:hypothetical protein PH210_09180 [Paenibacillus sp. BSR1-1]|uniref:hypothetical protein n=1 Tax=Paenibacillus sp. BSR1-1 TaxID=3020845 RepID=UPI0025AF86AF|nr:hypothetical protein [Paenibacillus sp. BSR1-1]MDN3016372.1 hypothetical protein [Paenibacillus sp. BSR1-1]
MINKIQSVYILENPEQKMIKFATDYQLRYGNIIKEVFGVACIEDLSLMIQFNRSFQESICKRNGINEKKITLDKVIRIASKEELLQLKTNMLEELGANAQEKKLSIPRPFDIVIRLKDGIFQWDDKVSSYILVNQCA